MVSIKFAIEAETSEEAAAAFLELQGGMQNQFRRINHRLGKILDAIHQGQLGQTQIDHLFSIVKSNKEKLEAAVEG